jgi:hypothetical protein
VHGPTLHNRRANPPEVPDRLPGWAKGLAPTTSHGPPDLGGVTAAPAVTRTARTGLGVCVLLHTVDSRRGLYGCVCLAVCACAQPLGALGQGRVYPGPPTLYLAAPQQHHSNNIQTSNVVGVVPLLAGPRQWRLPQACCAVLCAGCWAWYLRGVWT